MIRKVYITGIYGMLGTALVRSFNQNYSVYGCDIIENPGLKNAIVETYDLSDSKRLEQELSEIQPDLVINCAAMINVDGCEDNPKLAEKINADIPKTLAELSKKFSFKLIQISTDAVFDGNKDTLYSENDTVNPLNVYAKTKLLGEQYIQKISSNHTILRTNIYGWNLKKVHFAEWIYNSLLKKETITMFTDVYTTPIYVTHLAEIIHEIFNKDIKGLYNASGTEKISKHDFAIKLADIFSLQKETITPISVETFNFKAPRAKNMALSCDKLQEVIDFTLPDAINGIEKFKSEQYIFKEDQ